MWGSSFDSSYSSRSFYHAADGHIDEWLYRYVAGIQQWAISGGAAADAAAWAAVRIAPALLPGLHSVHASFDSPRGLISVAYEWDAAEATDRVDLTVEVPPGVFAEVVLPLSGTRVSIASGGRRELSDRRP